MQREATTERGAQPVDLVKRRQEMERRHAQENAAIESKHMAQIDSEVHEFIGKLVSAQHSIMMAKNLQTKLDHVLTRYDDFAVKFPEYKEKDMRPEYKERKLRMDTLIKDYERYIAHCHAIIVDLMQERAKYTVV